MANLDKTSADSKLACKMKAHIGKTMQDSSTQVEVGLSINACFKHDQQLRVLPSAVILVPEGHADLECKLFLNCFVLAEQLAEKDESSWAIVT